MLHFMEVSDVEDMDVDAFSTFRSEKGVNIISPKDRLRDRGFDSYLESEDEIIIPEGSKIKLINKSSREGVPLYEYEILSVGGAVIGTVTLNEQGEAI